MSGVPTLWSKVQDLKSGPFLRRDRIWIYRIATKLDQIIDAKYLVCDMISKNQFF